MKILWLRPTVGTHISTRRERIKEGLSDRGVEVNIVDASGMDATNAIKSALSTDYDIIVGTVRVGVYYGHLLARLKRIPFVAEVTEPIQRVNDLPEPIYRFFSWYEFQVLKRADACFYVEENVLETARQRGIDGILAKNSVWYEQFANPDPEIVEQARKRLEEMGINLSAPLAVYIGGFTKYQHILEILEATKDCSEWEFLFLGEGGEHATAVETAASSQANVHYPGAVPHTEVPGYLSFADVGFSLSKGERPLKLLEYGAAGLPVLGIPGKRQREFSENEVHYIEPIPEAIANALKTLRLKPEHITADGTALQAKAKENSWDIIAEKYYTAFCKIIDS